jgi:Arc/MetJ-type ribon-helix-helix transcriptional regulator
MHLTADTTIVKFPLGAGRRVMRGVRPLWYLKRPESRAVQFDEFGRTDYLEPMRVETSIAIDKDLLEAVDRLSGKDKNRSEFIEAAIQAYIAHITRYEQNAKDLEIINQCADDLNEEALDVLDYQVAL